MARRFRSLVKASRPGQQIVLADGSVGAHGSVREVKELTLSSYFGGGLVTANPAGIAGKHWTFQRAVVEAHGRVVWVYRAVEVLAGVYSRLPLVVADITTLHADQEPDLILDDPILRLLSPWGKANSIENGMQYRHRKAQQVLLSPRGTFTEALLSRGGTPLSFTLLPPGRTRIIAAKDGSIDHYEVDPYRPGDKIRSLEPDTVVWDRDVHPDNPYAGMTPLEAAGLSIEMDHFARLFNRSFLANDDGVSKIVGVAPSDEDSGEMSEEEQERIERKLGTGQGPLGAGRTVVLDGKITLADVGRTPKDASYETLRMSGRDEISVAFYVPLSKMGDASGRTFANAGQEDDNWWPERMAPFADTRAAVYSPFTADGLAVIPDYSRVDALNRLKKDRRTEMAAEVKDGLRTPLSYAIKTKQPIGTEPGDFPDVPGTRVLWRAGGIPVGEDTDAKEASKLMPVGLFREVTPPSGAHGAPPAAPDLAAQQQAGQTKGSTRGHATKAGPSRGDDDDSEDDRAALDAAVEGALAALAQRQLEQVLAKLSGVKARRETVYWNPPGTKAINTADVLDPDEWAQQAYDAAAPLLVAGAAQAAVGTYDQLAGQEVAPAEEELPPPPEDEDNPILDALVALAVIAIGTAPETVPAAAVPILAYYAAKSTLEVAELIADAARHRGERVVEAITAAQTAGAEAAVRLTGKEAIAAVQAAATAAAGDAIAWAKRTTTSAVTGAVEGTRTTILRAAGDRLERVWRTRKDDRVRPHHHDAEGQVRRAAAPFDVGGEQLRWPCDSLGRPDNVINCRCRVSYRIRRNRVGYTKGLEDELELKVFEEDKHPRGFHGRFGHVMHTASEGLSDALEIHHAPSRPAPGNGAVPEHLVLPAGIKRSKAHVKAAAAAVAAMPFGPARTRDDREHDSEVIRLEGLIARNREEQDLYQRAIDRNEVPPEWLDNPREGVPLGSTDAYGGQHMTRERAQEQVDDREQTIARIQAKLDDYEAYRARNGGWSNATGMIPSLIPEHYAVIKKAGKAIDKEADRRYQQALELAGLADPDEREAAVQDAYKQTGNAFADIVADLYRQGRDGGLVDMRISDARERAAELYPEVFAAFNKAEADLEAHAALMRVRKATEQQLRAMAYREVLAEVRPMGRGDRGVEYTLASEHTPGYHRVLVEQLKPGQYVKGGTGDRLITEVDLDPASSGSHSTYFVTTVNPKDATNTTVLRVKGHVHADIKVDDVGGKTPVNPLEERALTSLQRAEEFYPTAWHEAAADADSKLTVVTARRGFHSTDESLIALSDVGNTGGVTDDHTAVHELGHHFEHTIPDVRVMEYALYLSRTTAGKPDRYGNYGVQEPEQPLPGYSNELARFDKFPERYTGKTYRSADGPANSPSAAYELLTTVAESLFAGSQYDDADLRAGVLGILATV